MNRNHFKLHFTKSVNATEPFHLNTPFSITRDADVDDADDADNDNKQRDNGNKDNDRVSTN